MYIAMNPVDTHANRALLERLVRRVTAYVLIFTL